MYAEKNNLYTRPQKKVAENRVVSSAPVQNIRKPVSPYLPNEVRVSHKNRPDLYVKQLQVRSKHIPDSLQQVNTVCRKKDISVNRIDTEPANTDGNVIQRQMDWNRFQDAFNLAGSWLEKAAENVFHRNAPQVFAYAKIRYTENIAFRIIGKVSHAYNEIKGILPSRQRDALAWVYPDIDTIIHISEKHVNEDALEDVATTILHELSHYHSSLDTDDIEYLYDQEDFEQGSENLTYATAKNNADSIAFLIRNLANL